MNVLRRTFFCQPNGTSASTSTSFIRAAFESGTHEPDITFRIHHYLLIELVASLSTRNAT